jgi:hypothetical protein
MTAGVPALNSVLLGQLLGTAIYFARVCHLREQSGKKFSDASISQHGAYSHICLRGVQYRLLLKNGFSEKRSMLSLIQVKNRPEKTLPHGESQKQTS